MRRQTTVLAAMVLLLATGPAPRADAEIVKIAPDAGEYRLADFIETIAKATGEKIVYGAGKDRVTQLRITFVAAQNVPRDLLIPWLRAVLSFNNCHLVPTAENEWYVIHVPPPGSCKTRPVYATAANLEEWADEVDFFVATPFRFEHFPDPSRPAANAREFLGEEEGEVRELPEYEMLYLIGRAPKVATVIRRFRRLDEFAWVTRRLLTALRRATLI
jgi:hypothetical protein